MIPLRPIGTAMFNQAVLQGQLAQVEWLEEKSRLLKLLAVAVFGFACVLCLMLFIGALVLAFSWRTVYFIPAAIIVIVVYGCGATLAWQRYQALSAQGGQAFAATREELAADIAVFKGNA